MTATLKIVPEPPKWAVLYLRVSTREQMERDGGGADGYSLPAQQLACETQRHSRSCSRL